MKKQEYVMLWGLFIGITALHVVMADFPKIMTIYPDELRYLSIARSISEGKLLIHNTESDFQKILYSLIIAPAFWVNSPILQIKIISWLNSILVSTSIFPVYLLGKKMLRENWKKYFIAIFSGVMPATLLAMTFMSEVIFIPLSLWTIFIGYRILDEENERKKIKLAAIFGILCYLCYLNKEISLYYIISMVCICVRSIYKKQNRRAEATALITVIVFFALPHFFMKLTIFSGMGNSYDQMGLLEVLSVKKVLYMVYALFYNSIFATIAVGIFPIILFIDGFKEKREKEKRFMLFVMLAWLVGIGAIVYTISVREDYSNLSIRQHLRYLEPLTIPLLVNILAKEKIVYKKTIIKGFFAFGILLSFILHRVGNGPIVDQQSLLYYNFIIDRVNAVLGSGAIIGERVVKILLLGFMVTGGVFLFRRSYKDFLGFFLSTFLCVNIININLGFYAIRTEYGISKKVQKEMAILSEILNKLEGNILVISPRGLEKDNRLIDTYIDRPLYITSIEYSEMDAAIQDGIIDLENEKVFVEWPWGYYKNLTTIDYILAEKDIQLDNVKKIGEGVVGCEYVLYKNSFPEKVFVSK